MDEKKREQKKSEQFEIFDPAIYNGECLPFSAEAELIVKEAANEYTALRLKKLKPEVYELVRALRATGWSLRRVMDLCKVGYHTVVEIDRREANFIAAVKAEMAKTCHGTARNLLDLVNDSMQELLKREKLNIDEIRGLVDSVQKLVNVGNLLNGDATEILEHREKPKFRNWRDWEDQKKNAIDA